LILEAVPLLNWEEWRKWCEICRRAIQVIAARPLFHFSRCHRKSQFKNEVHSTVLSRAITVPFAKQLIISPARAALRSNRWFFATILLRYMQNAIAAWPAKNLISAFYTVLTWNLSSPAVAPVYHRL